MGASVRFTPLLDNGSVSPSAHLLQLATDPEHSVTLLLDAGWDERFSEAAVSALLVRGFPIFTLSTVMSTQTTSTLCVCVVKQAAILSLGGLAGSGTQGGCRAAQSPGHCTPGRAAAPVGPRRDAGARMAGHVHNFADCMFDHEAPAQRLPSSCWLPTQAPIYATVPVQRMGQVTMRDACRARTAAAEAPPFSLADLDRAFAHITQLRWRQTVNLPGALPLHFTCAGGLPSGASCRRAAGILCMSCMLLDMVKTCV